jgi:tetratricopeptide (TPR) repeat protein
VNDFENKLADAATLRELFERSLGCVLELLSPERAFIAYKQNDTQELVPQGTHGIDPQAIFVTGEISLTIIKNVMRDLEPALQLDAGQDPGLAQKTSVVLSGLRSILCVPIKHPSGLAVGVVYADNRLRAGAFSEEQLNEVLKLTKLIEARLVPLVKATAPDEPAKPVAGDDEAWRLARAEGIRLFQTGQIPEAGEALARAQQLAEAFGPLDPRLARSLSESAEWNRVQNRLDVAERLLVRSVEIFERRNEHHHPDLAPSLNNLAGLYFSRGNGLRAEGLYQRALAIWQETLGPDDKRFAPVLFNLATIRVQSEDYANAARQFKRAADISERAWGPEHAYTERCKRAYHESCRMDDLSRA